MHNIFNCKELRVFLRAVACCALLYIGPGLAKDSFQYPPPPEPPPPPPGVAQVYYSTCAGSHPAVKYVLSSVKPGQKGYREVQRYANSPAYRRYRTALLDYKKRYYDEERGFGEVDPNTGKRRDSSSGETPPETKKSGADEPESKLKPEPAAPAAASAQAQAQPAEGPAMSEQEKEDALRRAKAIKSASETDPAQESNGFGKLPAAPGRFLGYEMSQSVNDPFKRGQKIMALRVGRDPKQDLARWFRGFLYHDAVHAVAYEGEAPEAVSRAFETGSGAERLDPTRYYGFLVKLLKGKAPAASRPSSLKLVQTLAPLWSRHWKKALGFEAHSSGGRRSGEESRRMTFIRAMDALLRLAPEGGFGRSFHRADPKRVQAGAERILREIGPPAAPVVWEGLAEDLRWIEAHEVEQGAASSAKDASEQMRRRRRMAAQSAESVLKDPRLDGLSAVRAFLARLEGAPDSPSVLRKAFELLDTLGTLKRKPETLATLPLLAQYTQAKQESVARRARWAARRILGASFPKTADVTEYIGYAAPLLDLKEQALAGAAEQFLRRHTGADLGRDAKAWLKWKARHRSAH